MTIGTLIQGCVFAKALLCRSNFKSSLAFDCNVRMKPMFKRYCLQDLVLGHLVCRLM